AGPVADEPGPGGGGLRPQRRLALEEDHVGAGLGQVQRGRGAEDAAADDDDVSDRAAPDARAPLRAGPGRSPSPPSRTATPARARRAPRPRRRGWSATARTRRSSRRR